MKWYDTAITRNRVRSKWNIRKRTSDFLQILDERAIMYVPLEGSSDDINEAVEQPRYVTANEEPNVVSSMMVGTDMHLPTIDIDVPHFYVESSTPGNGHLYINTPLSWDKYVKLLDVLVECGIVEPGYVNASKARKATFLRLPWIEKEKPKTKDEEAPIRRGSYG